MFRKNLPVFLPIKYNFKYTCKVKDEKQSDKSFFLFVDQVNIVNADKTDAKQNYWMKLLRKIIFVDSKHIIVAIFFQTVKFFRVQSRFIRQNVVESQDKW